LTVIAAGKTVFADRLVPFKAELPICIGTFLLIPVAVIGEMPLENRMEGVFAS